MCFLAGFRRKNILDAKVPNVFLPLELFKKIIDQLSDFSRLEKRSRFSVILTGGEAFLHPDILEMLAYARDNGIGLTIFTNGTLIDDTLADKIVRLSPAALMFSVDGPREIHNQIRGKGNFEKTYSAIKTIQSLKKELNFVAPQIFINSLINVRNVGRLEEFLDVWDDLNIDGISFSHIQWSNQELTGKALKELEERLGWSAPLSKMIEAMEHQLYVKESQVDSLIDEITNIKDNYQSKHSYHIGFLPDLSVEEIRLWYSQCIYPINSCQVPSEWLRIGVSGDVYPVCALLPFPWGNIATQPIVEILNREMTRKFFAEIMKGGLFYACHRCCRRPSNSICIK